MMTGDWSDIKPPHDRSDKIELINRIEELTNIRNQCYSLFLCIQCQLEEGVGIIGDEAITEAKKQAYEGIKLTRGDNNASK